MSPRGKRIADTDGAFSEIRAEGERAVLRMFREFGGKRKLHFALGAIATIFARAMELVPAYVLAVAIDSLFFDEQAFAIVGVPTAWLPTEPEQQLLLAAALLAGAHVSGALLSWVNSWAWNHFAQHFQHEVRVETYEAMQHRHMGFFDNKQTGEIMSILNNDVNQLEQFLTHTLNRAIRIVVRTGGMASVMLIVNWRLGIVPTIVIPAIAYASYKFVVVIHPKYRAVRAAVGELNSRLENSIGGIQVVKSFTNEPFEADRVEGSSENYLRKQWEAIRIRIVFRPTIKVLTAIGYVATFVIGGWWVMFGSPHPFFQGTLTAGTLVMFLNYSRRFMNPLRDFGEVLNDYQYAEAAGERIVGLLDSEPAIADRADARELEDVEGGVEYRDVWFGYETADGEGETVLRDVSFTARSGQMIGLVGSTGAGKSTLVKLLLRMYDVDSGSVTIDGHDVRDVTLESLRASIGYVSQEPYLFHGTIRENIAYASRAPSDRDVERAARTAGAHEFIETFPDGYETVVGERGVKLSGGQRQRISIARAVLKDPDVIVLDEATSHVDNETEAIIQDNLQDLIEDRTSFVIAHRLSTVRDADTILVLDEGEVVERGTHDELLEENGLYATLWEVHVGELEGIPETFAERSTGTQPTDRE
ncbi:ABC transporter ATP-binding protein [Natrarchaeobius oligotrophus]|uniref:ABC transporter ATP-binding protein n=1 Tax=Natrarchaeobius chitinivorans TaxID=1679083 RepID=A0A3N6MXC6_NATCH|nr:ABC transporter ATP-binding protein [Natrarchaeobius chitinivorans]RQH02671.1 ABC transporter ATP-binding protein [Natrarchaeobius chitinivorans]